MATENGFREPLAGLDITDGQAQAWAEFVESLCANARRVEAADHDSTRPSVFSRIVWPLSQ
jgi:hypothetical protein